MEIVLCEIPKQIYELIPSLLREGINIKTVDVDNYDYSDDDKWKILKNESSKAYKKLKEHEFNLRNN